MDIVDGSIMDALSTIWVKEGRVVRKLKNLKGLVPGEGKGQERFRRQGVWSENS